MQTGHVIVFTGLLHSVETLDQLATVIAHEMAHVLLDHGVLPLAFLNIFPFLSIFSLLSVTSVGGHQLTLTNR